MKLKIIPFQATLLSIAVNKDFIKSNQTVLEILQNFREKVAESELAGEKGIWQLQSILSSELSPIKIIDAMSLVPIPNCRRSSNEKLTVS